MYKDVVGNELLRHRTSADRVETLDVLVERCKSLLPELDGNGNPSVG